LENGSCYDINEVDGIFPEIGNILLDDGHWQDLLTDFKPLKCHLQFNWVERLLQAYNKTDYYLVKSATYSILKDIDQAITQHILPYLTSISQRTTLPKRQMLDHWSFLSHTIEKVLSE